jgi:hypothetical protein
MADMVAQDQQQTQKDDMAPVKSLEWPLIVFDTFSNYLNFASIRKLKHEFCKLL